MEAIYLLQNNYRVPHVAVHEGNLKVCTSFCSALAPLDWSFHHVVHLWKGETLCLGIRWGGGGGGIPLISQFNFVLDLPVSHQ